METDIFWGKAERHTSNSGCFRFSSRWTQQEWRCSRTRLSQTTSQRRRTAPRGRWTEQFPAPRPRTTPAGAGWAPPPTFSPNRSTGESRAAQTSELQLTADDVTPDRVPGTEAPRTPMDLFLLAHSNFDHLAKNALQKKKVHNSVVVLVAPTPDHLQSQDGHNAGVTSNRDVNI